MRQRLTPAFLRQLLVLPSMLRERRLCRIALRQITVEIGQRYAAEATPGSER
jgi:hypothetical protein